MKKPPASVSMTDVFIAETILERAIRHLINRSGRYVAATQSITWTDSDDMRAAELMNHRREIFAGLRGEEIERRKRRRV